MTLAYDTSLGLAIREFLPSGFFHNGRCRGRIYNGDRNGWPGPRC